MAVDLNGEANVDVNNSLDLWINIDMLLCEMRAMS